MICPTCGKDNPKEAKFCMECGTKLQEPDFIKYFRELDKKHFNSIMEDAINEIEKLALTPFLDKANTMMFPSSGDTPGTYVPVIRLAFGRGYIEIDRKHKYGLTLDTFLEFDKGRKKLLIDKWNLELDEVIKLIKEHLIEVR